MAKPKASSADLAIAYKALGLLLDITTTDKAVATVILSHFNMSTGQCCPSNDRIARALGIDVRTVRRATSELCGHRRLFTKISHTGRYGVANYVPQWSVFREITAGLERTLSALSDEREGSGNRANSPSLAGVSNRANSPCTEGEQQGELARATGRTRPRKQGEFALQTHSRNSSKELSTSTASSECYAARDNSPENSKQISQGLLRGSAEYRKALRSMEKELAARPGNSRSDAARQAADRRVNKAIGCEAKEWRDAIWLLDPEDMDAAITAEFGRHGAGIVLLRLRMQDALTKYEAGEQANG